MLVGGAQAKISILTLVLRFCRVVLDGVGSSSFGAGPWGEHNEQRPRGSNSPRVPKGTSVLIGHRCRRAPRCGRNSPSCPVLVAPGKGWLLGVGTQVSQWSSTIMSDLKIGILLPYVGDDSEVSQPFLVPKT